MADGAKANMEEWAVLAESVTSPSTVPSMDIIPASISVTEPEPVTQSPAAEKKVETETESNENVGTQV